MRTLTHTAFGLTFAALIGLAVGVVLKPALGLFVILGALLPDIDTTASFSGWGIQEAVTEGQLKYGIPRFTAHVPHESFYGPTFGGTFTKPT